MNSIISSKEETIGNFKKNHLVNEKDLKKEISSIKEPNPKNNKSESLNFNDITDNLSSKKEFIENYNILKNHKYKFFDSDNSVIIGVLGNGNKGKSFLLHKLSDIKLKNEN